MIQNSATYAVPPVPAHEKERLAELHTLALLDSASEARFDHYTSLIADIFDFPIVLVSLVDKDRQWFKSACGLEIRETPRDVSFCAHAINHNSVFVVSDTHEDPRFAQNPLVVSEPYVRFYAGAVVRGPKGYPLGTLCVIDQTPRRFTDKDCAHLRRFADLIEREIRHRHDLDVLRASIEFSAYYDPLTRIANRRLLLDRLQKLVETGDRENRQVAVLLFNVASQRLINQSFGSEAGDSLLQQIADRLSYCNPPGGTVARLQGDEFVVAFALPQDDDQSLERKLEDIRASLSAPFQVGGRDYYLNIRCGVSLFPGDGMTPVQLIERASMAVRTPRRSSGSPNVRFFNTVESVSLADRLEIESRLRRAVEARAFSIVYQPIASLEDGRLASLEALIRWHDDVLGEVEPHKFIPIAEETGLIIALGQWALEEVCSQLDAWRRQGDWLIPVAVNVSATELMQPHFAADLLRRLDRTQLPHSMLCLEITETSIANADPLIRQNVETLVDASIGLAVDDFGTGYSALTYLQSLPVSRLKIDQSFVAGLPHKESDVILTQAIISMANGLRLETVGEGVESQEQLDFLRNAGCQYVQGFLVSRPLQAAAVGGLRGQRLI